MPFVIQRHPYPVPPLRALEQAERATAKRTANKLSQRKAKKLAVVEEAKVVKKTAKPASVKPGKTKRK